MYERHTGHEIYDGNHLESYRRTGGQVNAQGETWTIELTLETAGLMLSHTPVHVKNIEKILSIVRLHPRLVDVLEDAADYIHHTGGSVTMINGTIARANALGENRG